MKINIKISSIIAAMGLLASSCSQMNEPSRFDDKDACVAFNTISISFEENIGIANIPVTLRSLNGFTTSVSYKVTDGTAKMGVNFNVTGSNLSFTPTDLVQNIQIQIIDQPGLFTGDLSFTIELDNPGTVALGAEKKITVTIADLDHPLIEILGSYTATGQSYYDNPGEEQEWTVTILKDESDISKVWFHNLVPWVSGVLVDVFGIVDEDMTEIRVPIFQILSTNSGYPVVRLEGAYGPDGEEDILNGGFITIKIASDKLSLLVLDEMWAAVYMDAGADDLAGYFEALWAETILVKN